MREIAILVLLLVPNMGFLTDIRHKAEDYLMPKATVVSEEKTLPSAPAAPTKLTAENFTASAKASYSLDLDTNTELNIKNADEKLQIASLTKLMTAYVVLKDSTDLDQTVTVPNYNLHYADAVAGISAGEHLSKRDLLTAMLINSGSDAAQALAIIDSGDLDQFVKKMNSAAETLALANTHFVNPVGWDDANNYSSAHDVATLTRVLLGNEFFKETVGTKSKVIYTTAGRPIQLTTTNQLLGVNGYAGVKTGYTEGAGECLVSLEKTDTHEVLTVVLGSPDRFGETVSTNTWTNSHFLW